MCECSEVKVEDVAYRTSGTIARPYHKVCGQFLSKEQAKAIEEELQRLWSRPQT